MTADSARHLSPIGIFDSGLGGLTVVQEMRRRLPGERFVYVADTAHLPYGERPFREILAFSLSIARFLVWRHHCKALVIACNVASAVTESLIAARLAPIPVLGVLRPGARIGSAAVRGAPIAVLATAGTRRSGAYERALAETLPAPGYVNVVACPEFVPLIEAGESDSPTAYQLAADALRQALAVHDPRVVVLGCTHYPLLLPALREAARQEAERQKQKDGIVFVDPAAETVRHLAALLRATGLAAPNPENRRHVPDSNQFFVTGDDAARFTRMARLFLKDAHLSARGCGSLK